MHKTLGWDLGGAHLKAVLVDVDGCALAAVQHACPLWRGIAHLEQSVASVLAAVDGASLRHAVTMTGELADIFPDRDAGVARLAQYMAERLPAHATRIYAGRDSFVAAADIRPHAAAIASANWHASAAFLAAQGDALFIDIGSTTADLIPLLQGQPAARGYSDAERLQHEELVYTGVVRTPVMAVAQQVPFDGAWQRLAAEHFATMGDVYRLTGELSAAFDHAETADGSGKTLPDSARRLARMLGRELAEADMESWRRLAYALRAQQLASLQRALERVLSRGLLADSAPLLGAGAGRFLVRELALRMRRPYRDATELVSAVPAAVDGVGVCLPAYAVARLAQQDGAWPG
jgi:probable H4MPT-linked C1 transfer pathway protein